MGIIMTVILFSLIAAMNIYCSFLLIEVMHYPKKNVPSPEFTEE